jgi:hypothetical protein
MISTTESITKATNYLNRKLMEKKVKRLFTVFLYVCVFILILAFLGR